MPVLHTLVSKSSTPTAAAALSGLQGALEKLCAQALPENFEYLERDVHALFVVAEREVLAEQLERHDVDLPFVFINGRKHNKAVRSRACYTSAVGPLEVERTAVSGPGGAHGSAS